MYVYPINAWQIMNLHQSVANSSMVNALNLEKLNIDVFDLFVIFHVNRLRLHIQVDKLN